MCGREDWWEWGDLPRVKLGVGWGERIVVEWIGLRMELHYRRTFLFFLSLPLNLLFCFLLALRSGYWEELKVRVDPWSGNVVCPLQATGFFAEFLMEMKMFLQSSFLPKEKTPPTIPILIKHPKNCPCKLVELWVWIIIS